MFGFGRRIWMKLVLGLSLLLYKLRRSRIEREGYHGSTVVVGGITPSCSDETDWGSYSRLMKSAADSQI
jgi:hypothetical protein